MMASHFAGSAVRHHVSDPSERDMDQAEQPRHYSSTDDDESKCDGGYAAASTLPFGSDAGPRSALCSRYDSPTLQFGSHPGRDRLSVASPGFVTRRGEAGNLVIQHSRLTSGPDATAAR